MKKLYTLIALLFAATSIFAQLNESFEGAVFPPAGWTKAMPDGGTGWRLDTAGTGLNGWNGSGVVTTPATGGSKVVAMTYLDGGSNSNDSWLITPQINLTAGNTISFYAANLVPSFPDKLEIYISTTTNQANAFTTKLMEITDLTNAWQKIYLNLSAYAGQNIYIAFREVCNNNITYGGYVCIDMVATEAMATYPDLKIADLISPLSSASLSATSNVKVLLKNKGYVAATGYTVSYKKGNAATVTENGTVSIAAGDTMTFTFATPVNLSAIATDSIKIWVSLAADVIKSNDTLPYIKVTHYQSSSLPMNMGFEAGDNVSGWILKNINMGSTWKVLKSAAYAHSGEYFAAYSYDQNDNTLPADDWIISNGISMTAGQNLNLSFYYRVSNFAYPERLKVYLMKSNSINDTLGKLVNYTMITDTVYQHSVSNFTVPSTGIYYIGFHAYSIPDMGSLIIDDISVSVGTGINEVVADETFRTFPNPAREVVNIVSASTIKSLVIYNSLGQAVINMNPDTDNIQLNTSSLENGIYVVKAITTNGQKTAKLVIK